MRRPSPRSTRRSRPSSSRRGLVLHVRIEHSPAYELVLSAAVAVGRSDARVAQRLRARSPESVARLRAFAASEWMWTHLVSVVAEARAPRAVEDLHERLEAMPAAELLRRLVGYYVTWFRRVVPPSVIDRAVAGDRDAIRAFVAESDIGDASWGAALEARLGAGAARTKRDLLPLLAEWERTAFVPVVARSLRAVRAMVNVRRRELADRSADDVVSAMTGWRDAIEPDVARVLVVPSLVLREIHEFEHGRTKLVCVPLRGSRASSPRAPRHVLRVARALSDESRLRIVRALAQRELGAQELADLLGLGLTTVLHHLAELRDAGIVRGGGRRRPYRIDRAELRRAGASIARI